MNGIYWLASYPKSGNTWTRTLLTNYLGEKEVPADINALETDSIASARHLFDEYIGLASSDLNAKQIKLYQPFIYEQMAKESHRDLYMKVHDAYTLNTKNFPIIPASATKGVIYILRNPLDVAVSYAHHSHKPIDISVKNLCDESFTIAQSNHDLSNQLLQLLLSWSGHVNSWVESGLRVHLMRYEDMITDPLTTFKGMLEFMGFEINEERLRQAVDFSSFDTLKKLEKEKGFKEKPTKAASFFRKGKIGSYREELTQEQIDIIVEYHRETMIKYGYLDEHNQLVY